MPRGDKSTGNVARQERDLKAFELSLNGISVRGIMEELEIKSTQTAWAAIERGKKFAIERGIDVEQRRIEIDRMFKETLGLLVGTAKTQAFEGQIETTHGPMGTIVKTRKGIDPRIAGELSRSLNRWAEFCGLLDRAPELNQQATVINLSAPTDGASFADKWNAPETVDVTPSESSSESNLGMSSSDPSAALDRPTLYGGVEESKRTQQELF